MEEKETNTSKKNNFFARVSTDAWVVAIAIILASLFVSAALTTERPKSGMQNVQGVAAQDAAQNAGAADAAAQPTAANAGKTTFDDDPVMGDTKTAKVAIVEFSDYECPFCQKFHEETHDALVDKYVKTGKAVLVTRDYPLPFHEPTATMEAGIAQYVYKEKGVDAFMKFSQDLYTNTQTNGKGLVAAKLDELIKAQGLDPAAAKAYADSDEAKQEIAKDMQDGQAAGVEGTPSFVVGTFDQDGNVSGELLVGALPQASFEQAIDKYLEQ